jgi:hypothetical protein
MPKEFRPKFPGSLPVPQTPVAQFGNTPAILFSRLVMENPSHSASYTGVNKFLNPEFPNIFFTHSEDTVANPFTHS